MLADLEVPLILEVANDFLHGALGNAHLERHITQTSVAVTRKTNQYVTMVAEKRPIAHHLSPKPGCGA
jgi:hypothetical protein